MEIMSFGGAIPFNGTIDFNGKKLIRSNKATIQGFVFRTLGTEGLILNMIYDLKNNKEIEGSQLAFINDNYGTLRNIQINLVESQKVKNKYYILLIRQNYGTIENFVVNFQEPHYGEVVSGLVYTNYGIIKNGYVIGKNIDPLGEDEASASITISNSENAVIKNIFSLVSVDTNGIGGYANIAVNNSNNATISNVYSVGLGKGINNFSTGPNVLNKNSKKIYNNYYFNDEIFTSELETKGNPLSLYDVEFQNQILNEENAFIVDELVTKGFYPQLKMPDCMPAQEYIELPEVENADLPDILSTKILEQGSNTVKVEFSVNNPSAATISKIVIENIETVEIISQKYNEGKSTVIVELKDPVLCVSSYDVQSISTKGAFGSTYTRDYLAGERTINVDLFKEIWSAEDWKNIKNSPTENYMLMTDLDFINEGGNITIRQIHGILDGNNHTISNVTLNTPLIWTVYGTVKNIIINNVTR